MVRVQRLRIVGVMVDTAMVIEQDREEAYKTGDTWAQLKSKIDEKAKGKKHLS